MEAGKPLRTNSPQCEPVRPRVELSTILTAVLFRLAQADKNNTRTVEQTFGTLNRVGVLTTVN